jgi:hypothetical protein
MRIVRSLRGAVWGVAAALSVWIAYECERRFLRVESAPQQAALAGLTLVELVTLYVVTRAVDRVLALLHDGLDRRRPA